MSKPALKSSAARMRAAGAPARNRRKRDGTSARVRISNVIISGHEEKSADAIAGERIADFLIRHGWSRQQKISGKLRWLWRIPTICVVNGVPLLQRQWKRRRIHADDVIVFISRPYGGGAGRGKAIAGIVATIALAAFAPWASSTLLAAGMAPIVAYGGPAAIGVGGLLCISALGTVIKMRDAQCWAALRSYSL
jgi:hypothetical protein